MKVCAFGALLVLVILPSWCLAQYSIVREYSGPTFFEGWNYFGNWDNLTLGDVFYLDQASAVAQNLAFVNGAGNAVIRVDNFTNVPLGEKRNSIRLESKDMYDVGSLWIIDALHIPYGCSVWPAFWSKGDNWPIGGEIDIVEAINLMDRNQVSLHTTDGCTKTDTPGAQLGKTLGVKCATGSGCVTAETKPNSYGKTFGDNGGGVFATQFDTSGIYMWYWPRSAIPESIKSSSSKSSISLMDWGLPSASYPATSCNITQHFTPQRLVLNIALCGVWAGVPSIYKSTCGNMGSTGQCYNDNVVGPGSPKYDNAYFEIPYIRAYTVGVTSPSSTSAIAPTSVTVVPPVTTTGSRAVAPPAAKTTKIPQSAVSAARPRAYGLVYTHYLTIPSLLGISLGLCLL